MKEKQCGVCLQYFPAMWKAKTKTEPQKCKSCAMKNATPISNYRISNKSAVEDTIEFIEGLKKGINQRKQSGTEKYGKLEELKKLAVNAFNKFIRERDCIGDYFTCISCGEFKNKRFAQAGHFIPSTYSQLKYNEDNVHAECLQCNCIDNNHLVGYRKNLINKIGVEKVEWLESHNIANTKKWDRQELLEIISKYK